MRLSVKSCVIAAALLKAIGFLFVALMNLISLGLIPRSLLRLFDRFDPIPRCLRRGSSFLPPYGGPFLALLSSVYLGYDAATGPISVLVRTLYSLIAGGFAGAIFGWLYNGLADRF